MIAAAPVLFARSDVQSRIAETDSLSAVGFTVIEVESTDVALSYLESRSDIRMVIADTDMPGCLSGLDLARFVSRRWPHIPVFILGWPLQPTPSLPPTVSIIPEFRHPLVLLEEVQKRFAFPSEAK